MLWAQVPTGTLVPLHLAEVDAMETVVEILPPISVSICASGSTPSRRAPASSGGSQSALATAYGTSSGSGTGAWSVMLSPCNTSSGSGTGTRVGADAHGHARRMRCFTTQAHVSGVPQEGQRRRLCTTADGRARRDARPPSACAQTRPTPEPSCAVAGRAATIHMMPASLSDLA